MLKKILLALVVLLLAVLLFAATRPDSFRVERSARIQAPPDKVFALIDDMKAWAVWSPWEKLDPALQRSFSGAPSGKGAVYAWSGNKDVGQGRMEITESTPPSKVVIQLDFIAPFAANNITDFTLQPDGDGTRVNWAMHGPSPYVSKLMGLFFSMDSLVGKDFEKGLANMKAAAEK